MTSSPAGINCGATCSFPFDEGTVVTLSHSEAAGTKFKEWTGACTGTGACVVTMSAAKSVDAVFTKTFTLTVIKSGAGSSGGTVTSSPAGINCAPTCAADFDEGTVVTLSHDETAGTKFKEWTGACTGAGACVVTMSSSKSVGAVFTKTFALTVTKGGAGASGGTVTSSPAAINCAPTCAADFDEGTVVTLSHSEAAGTKFKEWTGACTGTGACVVTMSAAKAVTATFIKTFALTVSKAGTGSGVVSCDGGACLPAYDEGTKVTLAATPDASSNFSGWSGACTGAGACQVTMSEARSVTATFVTKPPHVTPPPTVDCVVPKLAGKTLAQAKSALTAANCTLGKVTKPKAKKGKKLGPLVVKSSTPAAGATLPQGSQGQPEAGQEAQEESQKEQQPSGRRFQRGSLPVSERQGHSGGVADLSGPVIFLLAIGLLVALWVAGAPGRALAAGCPNEAIRTEQGAAVLALPDCMALEQVSPAKKGNQLARNPISIAANGKRVVFNSFATLDPEVPNLGGITGDLFLASRGDFGWATRGANLPYGSGGVVGGALQVGLSPDLTQWLQLVRTVEGVKFFREGADHSFTVLSPLLVNLTGSSGPSFLGTSTAQSHVYLRPDGNQPRTGSFLPGDPLPDGVGEDSNLYVSHLDGGGQPVLELAAKDLNGKVWGANCGARLGGIEPTTGNNLNLPNGERNQGAISADGSHVYFSTRPSQPAVGNCSETHKKRIMVREETLAGPVISELFASECTRVAPPCSASDGDDAYQGASLDQTKVYFTTTRQLANTDLDTGAGPCSISSAVPGCDLYLYDSAKAPGEHLTQVSAGDVTNPTPGAGANLFNSIAAISADGSRVYFVAQSVLTTDPSPKSTTAAAGQPNLYTWNANTGETDFIGTVAANDGGSGLWGSDGTWNNGAYPVPIADENPAGPELGGDGHILLFKSNAPLTADDTDGTFRDVFRYDAVTEALVRISKGGPGGSDNGGFNASPGFGGGNAPPGGDYAARGRPISEDGETIEFTTSEGLLPGDPSEVEGVYLWRGGQVYRLPGSTQVPNTATNNPALSADGSTVAYHTTEQLLPSDGDSAMDIYVARVDGGYKNPPLPEICQIDDGLLPQCQSDAVLPPVVPSANPPDRAGNLTAKPPCPKGKVRKHGKCVKKPSKGKKKHQRHSQRAGAKQGGQK